MKSCCRVAAFVVLALAFGPLPSAAGDIEKARELIQITGAQKMMQDILPTMATMITNGLKQNHPNLPPDVPDIVAKVVSDTITPLVPEMLRSTEKLYADTLTNDELNGAIAFYKTPAGQGLLKKMPVLIQQGVQIGQAAVQAHIPEMQKRLTEELQKRHPEMK